MTDENHSDNDNLRFARMVATRRANLGLSVETLAELVGADPDAIVKVEAGQHPGMYMASWLEGILNVKADWSREGAAVEELDANAAALGCWNDHAPLLAWARRLYQLDFRISWRAEHASSIPRDPARAERAAQVPAPALGPVHVASFENARRRPTSTREWIREDHSTIDYLADGIVLAGLVRDHLGLPPDKPVDPTELATRLGASVASAPAHDGSWVKGLLLRVASTALIVTNSRLNPVVTRFSVAHLLGHLAAGDAVGTAIIDYVEDQDDDSIYCCTGAGPDTCRRADMFAAELLVPSAYLAGVGDWSTDWHSGPRPLWSWTGTIQRFADELDVAPYVVAERAVRLDLISDEVYRDVDRALSRRSPFGGRARDGARDAVHHEDLALPAGDGKHRMPAALRARALVSWETGVDFRPARELFEDADLSDADMVKVRAIEASRRAELDDLD